MMGHRGAMFNYVPTPGVPCSVCGKDVEGLLAAAAEQ